MNNCPSYFEPIRQEAAELWDLLDRKPSLAGPWHQLFRQVQSPRHVLSELLQNADDVGATEASVRIEDGVFVFEHNGEDFTEEHFASLCRFGYSNKRSLHTIGFRGIGFKSTFSLGSCVEVYTPSLSVGFRYRRFTEPIWLSENAGTDGKTCIRVPISDEHRRGEVAKNLADWVKSPLSLLFFRMIRRIRVGEDEVHWFPLGDGPVPGSQWMALRGQEDERFLFVRSAAEEFPTDALAEIKQEREVTIEEEVDFPPSRVEIVLGAPGRLFVVLPTGIETELPFACNAPFIQDPARDKIKALSTSATNRWLLQRAGKLAGSTMLAWLRQQDMPIAERACAYGLLPNVDRNDTSPEGVCATLVEEAFHEEIEDKKILLTESASLARAKQGIVIPREIAAIWPADRCAKILDAVGRPALSSHVGDDDRGKLLNLGLVEEITKQQFLAILRDRHLPKPTSWRGVLTLWAYIAPEITGTGAWRFWAERFRIVPVQGQDTLHSAEEVVRLGEKKLLQSEDDWRFLAEYLLVMNQNWTRFLATENRSTNAERATTVLKEVDAAYAVLEKIGLADASEANKIIAQMARKFFAQEDVSIDACVRFAQIAAKFGATVDAAFKYVTRDGFRSPPDHHIFFDKDGALEEFIPEEERAGHMLHDAYVSSFASCTPNEWHEWVQSGRAKLVTFAPLTEASCDICGKLRVEREMTRRGYLGRFFYKYVPQKFILKDWDFPPGYWEHWETLAGHDEGIWGRIAQRFLLQGTGFWKHAKSAQVVQVSQCNTQVTLCTDLLPNWVLRFREVKCLPDTHGILHKPGELLRRTPETEALLDAEPFLKGELDTEVSRPLLGLLEVRSKPTGPDRILDCLRALAKAERPLVQEVDKWYRRLDQMFDTCSTVDSLKINAAFGSERLILTSDGAWANTAGVFLAANDEDAPAAAVIRTSVEELSLWRKIGVEDRPTADLAIAWLETIVSGQSVPREDVDRVRAILRRYPVRIWNECEHWLNLVGEWAPTHQLSFALTMQSLTRWQHLHPWVKNATADLQGLHSEVANSQPFSVLPTLASVIEDRLWQNLSSDEPAQRKVWMTAFGTELCRVVLDSDEETQRVRNLGERLAHTGWRGDRDVEIIPYINGAPAGTARPAEVVWLGKTLYTGRVSRARLAKRVPEEIGKIFGHADITAALGYAYERSGAEIQEYLEENFTLVRAEDIPQPECASLPGTAAEDVPTETRAASDSRVERFSSDARDDARVPASPEIGSEEGDASGEAPADLPSAMVEGDSRSAAKDRAPRSEQPGILDRFAAAQGFSKDGDDRFSHGDGSWIARARGEVFPWQRHAASGDVVQHYWPKNHCMKQSPLQLEAEVWWLVEKYPESHSLILADVEGEPTEVTGTELREMRTSEKIVLHPATYRLVYVAGGTAD